MFGDRLFASHEHGGLMEKVQERYDGNVAMGMEDALATETVRCRGKTH